MTDIQLDFRDTSGYVTDNSPATYCLHTDGYPTTRGTFTFGWDNTLNTDSRDRNNGIDVRLAGVNYNVGPTTVTLRVDLPATGSYDIYFAGGDNVFGFGPCKYEFLDNTTSLFTLTPGSLAADHYVDAGGTVRTSNSDWVTNGSGVKSTQTFATTTFFLKVGNGASADSRVAHLRLVQAAAAGKVPYQPWTQRGPIQAQ